MRIIAGSKRGTQIFAPRGQDTRPTQDRVKESLFNIIQAYVPEATVLDLFAGSGALALEAISRGAAQAVLVDMDREAGACIRRNIAKLGFENAVKLYPCEFRRALAQMMKERRRFDLVFLDPPYRMTELAEICDELANGRLLANGAMLVLEHRSGFVPALDARFTLFNQRGYGDTEIHFYLYAEEEEP